MSDITATLRLESPTLALTETVAHDRSATVRPLTGSGTVPARKGYLFAVQSANFDRFEAGLERDPTIEAFERVTATDDGAVYRFTYEPSATIVSPIISAVDGISIEWRNDGTAWVVRLWLPDRAALSALWEYARAQGIECTIRRVTDRTEPSGPALGLTDAQREALTTALAMGYFEEPRAASLTEVADELGISQPAAGGRLRRGVKRILTSTIGDDLTEESA